MVNVAMTIRSVSQDTTCPHLMLKRSIIDAVLTMADPGSLISSSLFQSSQEHFHFLRGLSIATFICSNNTSLESLLCASVIGTGVKCLPKQLPRGRVVLIQTHCNAQVLRSIAEVVLIQVFKSQGKS